MKHPQTLRSRIILYFCLYLAALLIVYSVAMIGIFRFAEDQVFNRQLSEISSSIAEYAETHGAIPDYLPKHITVYEGFQNVPLHLQKWVMNRDSGIFEIGTQDFDYHAAIVPLTSNGKMLYVIYDVESAETSEQLEWLMAFALGGVGFGIFIIGWFLARSLSNRILTPISTLARRVRWLSLEKDETKLNFINTPDEVGVLAETIENLLIRISEFTHREREFTSHASHELRTPVTVIKGATEILKSKNIKSNKKISNPLARIERAVTDIEMLIDTFLLLARKEQVPDKDEACDLHTIVTRVVDSHRYLLETKPVEVDVQTADSGSVQAPTSMVSIAVGNLVRNAFQYTIKGKIEIIALADRVCVNDSGPGIDSSQQSRGIGLTIVERLCERMDWHLTITGAPQEGTRADLIFSSSVPGFNREEDRSAQVA